ncbi:hypothetical protein [Brevibacillus sp. 179-C9.3 HS]|uniref:hypothetical protein n=1 Tax=unclassified Brevibacillus TaxID=2684853 RepID=UPI0039A22E1F
MATNNERNHNDVDNAAVDTDLTNMSGGTATEAAGTVGGAAVGAAVGSILGPLGTIAGAVAGGALGNEMGENVAADANDTWDLESNNAERDRAE